MSPDKIPNRIFIKLLLGFWLCSSIIIAAVGLLPLLQQKHDRAPLPQHLENLLSRQANRISEEPKLLEQQINLSAINLKTSYSSDPTILMYWGDNTHSLEDWPITTPDLGSSSSQKINYSL